MNLSGIVNSPAFSQPFTVYRKTTSFVIGGVQETETPIQMNGVISVANPDDLEQIPEGDRQKGAISIHCTTQLRGTIAGSTADQVLWRGNRWRVSECFPYADYGFYKAIAVKMDPSTGVDA